QHSCGYASAGQQRYPSPPAAPAVVRSKQRYNRPYIPVAAAGANRIGADESQCIRRQHRGIAR
ncbi:hypothetical protein EV177_010896, partial [Coemansia sp. RSA 1804]